MLASLTIFDHLSRAVRMVSANAAGVELLGTTPSFVSDSYTDGVATTPAIASLNLGPSPTPRIQGSQMSSNSR